MNTSRLIIVCFVALCIAQQAHCDLVVKEYEPGQKVTLDTVSGYHWYWNLPDFTNMTYDEQITAIAGLGTYGGIAGGWHMATGAEMAALWANPLADIGGPFGSGAFAPNESTAPPSTPWYSSRWWGRYDEVVTAGHPMGDPSFPAHQFAWVDWGTVSDGTQTLYWWKSVLGTEWRYDSAIDLTIAAWVVSNQSVIPVPPAVVLGILGLGVAGLKLRKFA